MKRTSAWRGVTTIESNGGLISLKEARARENERQLTRKEEREFAKILANRMRSEAMTFKAEAMTLKAPSTRIGFILGGVQ
jgi:hypothetical protein